MSSGPEYCVDDGKEGSGRRTVKNNPTTGLYDIKTPSGASRAVQNVPFRKLR
jgi:hypothetical protein